MNRQQRRRAAKAGKGAPVSASSVAALKVAFALHEQGQLVEAERAYRAILAETPRQCDALYHLGLLELQGGRFAEAAELISDSLKQGPAFAEGHYNHGVALVAAARPDAAETAFRAALKLQAVFPEAEVNLGNLLLDSGDGEGATAAFLRACEARQDWAEARLSLGNGLRELGEYEGAAEAFRQALALKPAYAEAANNLGLALEELDESEAAIASFEQAIALRPFYVEAYNNLAVALKKAHRFDDALVACAKALELDPLSVDALNNKGNILHGQRRFAEAEQTLRQAIEGRPDSAMLLTNLAGVLQTLNRDEEAQALYLRAIECEPNLVEPLRNLGALLARQGRFADAEAVIRRALALEPDDGMSLNNLGIAVSGQGRVNDAIKCFAQMAVLKPDYSNAQSNILFAMNYMQGVTLEQLGKAHRRFGEVWDKAPTGQGFANTPDPNRRLRIGYVSPDFKRHVSAYFIEGVLSAHDRSKVEVFCYAEVDNADDMTERLRGLSDHWRWIVGWHDEDVAETIGADGIDILVDLAGHTANNRLPIFGLKPAPIQVSWLGYPNTTGMKTIDYIFATPGYVPEAQRRYMTEAVYDLPRLPSCYCPPRYMPPVAESPCLAVGSVTFGCFNNITKVTTGVMQAWSRLLDAVPGSRLFLKSIALGEPKTAAATAAAFGKLGVTAERLIVEGPSEHKDYLEAYGRVDIALDPFPYNGGTTTIEALYMGLPLVALRGDRWVSRNGSAILEAMALDEELAADDVEGYIAKAAALATNPQRLTQLRREIRPRFLATGVADPGLLTGEVESAYREMWQRWCASRRSATTARDLPKPQALEARA
ncbi:MAG: tetratricopeptide repeat protein [Kiloniellales bacterium]